MKVAITPLEPQMMRGVGTHIKSILENTRHDITPLTRKEATVERLSKYDVIHSHSNPKSIMMCQQTKLAYPHIKWIHTYHWIYEQEFQTTPIKPWQKNYNEHLTVDARHADIKISVNMWLQDHLQNKYNIKTQYIPNGLDPTTIPTVDEMVPPYTFSVGYPTQHKKQQDYLHLVKQNPSDQFYMTGLENDHNIPNLISFKWLNKPDYHRILGNSDLYIYNGQGGIGIATLEAFLMKIPCLLAHEPRYSDIERVYGHKIPTYQYGNKEDLCEQYTESQYHPYNTEEIYDITLEEYDIRQIIQEIDKLYGEVNK